MKRKILDTIGMIIITIVIAIFNVIIGANEKGLRTLPISIMLFIAITYLIARKIILKQKIVIKNKIDIFVLLFMCSTLLPLIFKTYCTYQGTVEFILKYFFVYAIYLVVRNTVDSKNKVNIIIAVTTISSLIIAILGIDIQNQKYFNWLIEKLNLKYTESYAFVSTFGYANTVAIYFSFCIFLAINQIQNLNKKKAKILYGIYIIIALYVISQTVSRTVFVLLALAVIIYFTLYYIQNILQNKKKLKKIALIVIVVAMIFITFVFTIGTKVSKPFEFSDSIYQRNFNYNFEPNQNYTIELELDIENVAENHGIDVEVEILEINPYFNQKILAAKQVKSGKRNLTLNFTTTESLYQIDMLILNGYNEKITINKCYINGKEYPINYKFLSYEIGKALSMYSANDKSIKQRIDFWKDCIKISKDHPIIGQGGNTWKKLSQAVQDYPYGMKETHSYFFELLISYGIVGVVLYLLLIIYFNIKLLKECITNKEQRKYKLSILFGLNLIILHSIFFDFDMSFLVIMLIVFVYLAILMYDSKETIQKLKVLDYCILIFLSFIFIILIFANVAKYCATDKNLKRTLGFYDASYQYDYINESIKKENSYIYNLKEIQNLMTNEPYFYQNELYAKYWNLLLKNLKNLTDNQIINYIMFINNQYRTAKFITPMYIDTILTRVYIMQKAYLTLESMNYTNQDLINQIEALKQIIKDEYEVNIVNINDKERNGAKQENIDNIVEQYEKMLEKINL